MNATAKRRARAARTRAVQSKTYGEVRQMLVSELLDPGLGAEVWRGQLLGVLGYAKHRRSDEELVIEVRAAEIGQWVAQVLKPANVSTRQHPSGQKDRWWVTISEPARVLRRYGWQPGHWVSVGDYTSAAGVVRGALVVSSVINGDGLQVVCHSAERAKWLAELCSVLGVSSGVSLPAPTVVAISRDRVGVVLARLGVSSRVGAAYQRVIAENRATRSLRGFLAANDERTRAAGMAQARRIRMLGDLSAFDVPESQRVAAELRAAHPTKSMAQLAVLAGCNKDQFTSRITRFFAAVHKQQAASARGRRLA